MLILAVAVSALVIPVAMRVAPALGMIDKPDPRKVHRDPVPRVGGWGIVAGCLVPLMALNAANPLLQAWSAGSLVLLLFGAWDDAREIGHWPKFAGQLMAVGLVVFWGGLYVTRLPFLDGDALSPLAGRLFTMVAMVGVINAVNHADGLDGLAAGETLLSLIAIAFLGHLAGSVLVTDVALATIGGTVGFLRYNTHPARVFMGDSGSQFLGFTVAVLVVYLVQVASPAVSAALPLLLLGLPLADILAVLYQRAASGSNWFKATRNHVHHRLLDLGFSHFHSVVAIYLLQVLFVVSAVGLRYAGDGIVIATYVGVIVAVFALLTRAERAQWRLSRAIITELQGASLRLRQFTSDPRARVKVLWCIAIAICGLALFASLWVREVPRDVAALAAGMAAVMAVATATGLRSQPTALRAAAYIVSTLAVWLIVQYPRESALPLESLVTGITILLALAIGAFVRFMSDQRFGATPTDYLIVLALLALLLFNRFAPVGVDTGTLLRFIASAIVLFYGCEVLISHFERWRSVIGGSTFVALLIIALRGLRTLV